MNRPHDLLSKYQRKELVGSLKKGVASLLIILLFVLSGLYVFINMTVNEHSRQQREVDELIVVVDGLQENWLQLLLVEEGDVLVVPSLASAQLHQMMVSEYEFLLGATGDLGLSFSDSLSLLNKLFQQESPYPSTAEDKHLIYAALESLKEAKNALVRINVEVATQQKSFIEQLMWWSLACFFLILLVVIAMATDFIRQLQSGLAGVYYILDHHKHGHALIQPPRKFVDELTDLSHALDIELVSKKNTLNEVSLDLSIAEVAFSKIDGAFFIIDFDGNVAWLSAGAERLWEENRETFESVLGIDSGLDSPKGERVLDSLLLTKSELPLVLFDGMYSLEIDCLAFEVEGESEESEQGFVLSVKPKSEQAEFQVLHHSLKLMEQDIWNAPVRVLRSNSPYEGFARSLEAVRQNVEALFEQVDNVYIGTKSFEKVTKLQQIASLIDVKNNHNITGNNDVIVAAESSKVTEAELNDIAWLSEQIRDSLILGYELVLQRLSLVEKDLSSDSLLLVDVDRCLNEVRSGVLSSLSAADGESEKVRRRFAIDLEHDISQVQQQFENMRSVLDSTLSLLGADRSVGLIRLDKARESVSEMIDKIHELTTKMPVNALENNISKQPSDHDDL